MKLGEKAWYDRFGDEGDNWLAATRLEREGKFHEAAETYRKQADLENQRADYAREGLCLVSAARCMNAAGLKDEAVKVYEKAGDAYFRYANEVVTVSPNSAAWGYVTASKCFLNSRNYSRARRSMEIAYAIESKLLSIETEVTEVGEEKVQEAVADAVVRPAPAPMGVGTPRLRRPVFQIWNPAGKIREKLEVKNPPSD